MAMTLPLIPKGDEVAAAVVVLNMLFWSILLRLTVEEDVGGCCCFNCCWLPNEANGEKPGADGLVVDVFVVVVEVVAGEDLVSNVKRLA